MGPRLLASLVVAAALIVPDVADAAAPTSAPSSAGKVVIETFQPSAYPFDGMIPEQNRPFLEGPTGARYHSSPRGGKLMADTTYSDARSLLAIPSRFDPGAPGAAIIVFFHGNLATLRDVEGRQGVPRQLFGSGMNAALVAPQLAVNALDSSPGHFYDDGFFYKYLDAAEDRLAALSNGRFSKAALGRLPVIIAAYSGGYLATAFTLHYERPEGRIRGVILLDALFGEADKIEDWIGKHQADTFFVSAFSKTASAQNSALETALRAKGVNIQTVLPRTVTSGDVIFLTAPNAVHNDFVTRAWTSDPLRTLLSCIQIDSNDPPPRTCGMLAKDKGAAPKQASEQKPAPPQPASPQSSCPADAPACDPEQGRPIEAK